MRGWLRLACVSMAAMATVSCADDEQEQNKPAPEPCTQELAGECIGVPSGQLCEADVCTAGVECTSTAQVASNAELADAAATAGAGSCIALSPGSYDALSIAAGVSVLGGGVDRVALAALSTESGAGAPQATVRGVRLEGTLQIGEGASVRLEASEIASGAVGVEVLSGGAVAIEDCEIRQSKSYGVLANDGSVSIANSVIEDTAGPGVWAACSDGCACSGNVEATLDHLLLQRNGHVSVGLLGAQATLRNVHILESEAGPDFEHGGGLMASACAVVDVDSVTVEDATSFGVLVHGASMTQADAAGPLRVAAAGHGGLWLQNIHEGQMVSLGDISLEDNDAVGLALGGVDLSSKGIIVIGGGRVGNTASAPVPVFQEGLAGTDIVGDGIVWSDGVGAEIRDLIVSASERNAFLIDGAVETGSVLSDIALEGGDEAKGIVHQNSDVSGMPATQGTVPPVDSTMEERFAIPIAPLVPPAIAN